MYGLTDDGWDRTLTNRIKGLDGIRALAVISVVLTHLHAFASFDGVPYLRNSVLPLVHGQTGVLAFFVMSGFLITLLLVKEYNRDQSISVKNFYVRRALRIFPLYYLVIGLTLLAASVGDAGVDWRSVPFALTYTYNFVPKAYYSGILGHTWSLAVEEHFYLVWPLAVGLLISGSYRTLMVLAASAFLIAYPVERLLGSIGSIDDNFFVNRWTFVASGSIALGALLALIVARSTEGSPVQRLLRSGWAALLGLALFGHSLILDIGAGDQVRAAGIALLIAWIYLNQGAWAVAALEVMPMQYLGKISYGIYMWQGFFLATGPHRAPGQTWPPDPLAGLILLCVVAPLSYHFFEAPFLKMKHRFGSRTLEAQSATL